MSIITEPPKKRKNASKKSKTSWRKNTDVDDVEEFLEDRRLEERLGGSFADRPDDELFVVDTTILDDKSKKTESEKTLRQKRAEKPLKCFQHLEITTGVQDPIKVRNKTKSMEERENPIVKAMKRRLASKGIVKKKMKTAEEHRSRRIAEKEATKTERSTRRRTKFDFDLWSEDSSSTQPGLKHILEDEWLNAETKDHTARLNGIRRKKNVPDDFREKPSKLPAVELPVGGSSYNPSLKDHQELLWSAAITEIQKEKAIRKIERQTTLMFPSKPITEEERLKEMSEGLDHVKDKGEEEDDKEEKYEEKEEKEPENSDTKEEPENDKKEQVLKAKSKKQRRKEKEAKVANKRRKYELALKLKNQDVLRVKSFKKELDREEKLAAKRKLLREQKQTLKKYYQPKRLSSHVYQEPEEAIKLSHELTGNLRSLKPEGSLLEERFKSLQKRNIIETRVGTSGVVKRKKRKRSEKRNYKMDWEKNVK